jgi:type IV pilus assembly protein PilF
MTKSHKLITNSILVLAFLFFNSCVSLKNNDPDKKRAAELKLEIATGMIKSENYPGAMRELLSAEEDDPNNATLHHLFGLVYRARDRYELAEKHFLKALSINKDYTEARNSLAFLYIETGRLNKAEEQLNIALNDLTYSDYHKTYVNWGHLEFKRKDFVKAEQFFKKALQKDRENCPTHVMLGRSLLEAQELETALEQFERAMIFCGVTSDDSAHYFSAVTLYRKKDVEKSITRFEETIKLFPQGKNSEKSRKMISLIKGENR